MSEEDKAAPQAPVDAVPKEIATEKETSESDTNSEAGIPQVRELEQEEKRLLFKLDRAIVPLTALLYLSAYLDRSVPSFIRGDATDCQIGETSVMLVFKGCKRNCWVALGLNII